jgi:chlorite dismutase
MIDKFKTYSSTIAAIFSAGVVLYGVFKFVSQGTENADSNKEIQQVLKSIQENQQSGNIRLDSIESVVRGVDVMTFIINEKVEKVKNQFTIHLSRDKSVTKEELLEILNEMDEKKNVKNTSRIQLQ